MAITLAQMIDAVESTLSAATGLTYTQSYDELSEGIVDLPLLQVYGESGGQDAQWATDRTTFQGGVRQTGIVIHADLYAHHRSHLGEDMKKLVDLIDTITDVVEQQDTQPYFGLEGIKTFRWTWQRVVFTYGDPNAGYVGARFIFSLRVF